ncbi:MAG: metal ABC transporter ATP-binding protein [Chloroflexi bacterium]|nr:metal ABC transporter ATP-binding protein [Chloroflexota bacterium]MCH9009815.1 metal ABC transporter ATP-binding protein [Chloroflexota bacterium]
MQLKQETHADAVAGTSLQFENVWYQYDSEAVIEDISLSVGPGEFVAILGPNGSGKTTLIKLALGLITPSRGSVKLFGEQPEHFREWNKIGYVPQAVEVVGTQFPATVEEVVSQGLYKGFDPFSLFRRGGKPAVLDAMETAGIAAIKKRRISSLSIGQQQRTLISRALVSSPQLLVLDEPVAGVDAAGQEQLYSLLRRLNREQSMTILMVSHDIGAVLREATTVACINRSLVFHGPPHNITQKELSTLYGLPMDVLLHDVLHEHR